MLGHLEKNNLMLIFPCRFMTIFLPFFAVCLCFVSQLGKCVARDANPAANITWLRNNKPLVADGKGAPSSSCCMSSKDNRL